MHNSVESGWRGVLRSALRFRWMEPEYRRRRVAAWLSLQQPIREMFVLALVSAAVLSCAAPNTGNRSQAVLSAVLVRFETHSNARVSAYIILLSHLDGSPITSKERERYSVYFDGDTSLSRYQGLNASGSALICALPEGIYTVNGLFQSEPDDWGRFNGVPIEGVKLVRGKVAVVELGFTSEMYWSPIPWLEHYTDSASCK